MESVIFTGCPLPAWATGSPQVYPMMTTLSITKEVFFSALSFLQTGGVQRRSLRTDGALRARDGAGEEEAAHAGDQAAELRAGTGGCREPQPALGEGDGGFLFHTGGPGAGIKD